MRKKSQPRATLDKLIRDEYNAKSLKAIRDFFGRHRTHQVSPNSQGLFPATGELSHDSATGYQNAWVRDNVMIANSLRLRGQIEVARGVSKGLTNYFHKHLVRFRTIIEKPDVMEDVQQRPHVRFNGVTLEELPELWAHAQNDALGYALRLRFVLANDPHHPFPMGRTDGEVYTLFPKYFRAIEFWQDADSGSWEETRKINNSSVGVVLAGLEEMKKHIEQTPAKTRKGGRRKATDDLLPMIDRLIEKGRRRLEKTLPFEAPPEPLIDSAVLFLMHPVGVVKEHLQQDVILHLVQARLLGPYGIKRYLGDSYFCQDYDRWFPPDQQASDFSSSTTYRDTLLEPGCEAQWALFDPVISVIYRERYRESKDFGDLANQTFHFNRSLGQVTPDGKCPELYYLNGRWITNDHTPLLWTQANQALALHYMECSILGR